MQALVKGISHDLAQALWNMRCEVKNLPEPNHTTQTGVQLRSKQFTINGNLYNAYEGNKLKHNIDERDVYFYPVNRNIHPNYYVKIRSNEWHIGSWG